MTDIRLLIVEDYEDTAEHLAQWFALRGCESDQARTMATAVEMFNIRCDVGLPCYDGILLDLNLPDAFGTAFLKAVRDVHEDIPIFTATAFVDDFVRTTCRAAKSPLVLKPGFHFDGIQPTDRDHVVFIDRVMEAVTAYHKTKVPAQHPRVILPEVINRLIGAEKSI